MRSILVIIAALAATTLSAAEHGDHAHGKGDAAKTEVKAYPLETCIVSGEKLGSMGKPVVKVHEGQEVKFCCKSCIKDFKADPAKYIAKLEPAAEGKAKAEGHQGHDHGEHQGHDHKDHKGHEHKDHKGHDHWPDRTVGPCTRTAY